MRCFNCDSEVNPTLVYCSSCGVPLETDLEDIRADEERRVRETREIAGRKKAKELFVLGLFWLATVIAARVVLLEQQHHDDFVGFRIPTRVIEEAGVDPPVTVEVDPLTIPLPE